MPEWPLGKAAWEMWVTDESSPRGAGERREPERMEDEWAISTEEPQTWRAQADDMAGAGRRRQLFWGVWKGKGIGKNTRSGEMFTTLYVNQESWENKQHGEGAEPGEWERLRASHAGWRRGDGWTGQRAGVFCVHPPSLRWEHFPAERALPVASWYFGFYSTFPLSNSNYRQYAISLIYLAFI